MNVLLDVHHHDLFRSLYILFHNRLKCKIFVPFGMEWHTKTKYANYPNIDTVKQYIVNIKDWLNIGNDLTDVQFISFEEYLDIDIDIHIASLLENVIVFKSLIEKYKPKSKLIIQVGNNFLVSIIDDLGDNLLSSSKVVFELSKIKNKIFYHQEFDTNLFEFKLPTCNVKSINSFQHFFGTGCSPYEKDYEIFKKLKTDMIDFDFKCFGIGGEFGPIRGTPTDMSLEIKNSGFIFHMKPQGDGYGHIYHNAYACGKPVIYKSKYLKYNNFEMTPLLLFDDSTSIDMSKLNIDSTKSKIIEFSNNYTEISKLVYFKFKQVVNFDLEFEQIKIFIENLI